MLKIYFIRQSGYKNISRGIFSTGYLHILADKLEVVFLIIQNPP